MSLGALVRCCAILICGLSGKNACELQIIMYGYEAGRAVLSCETACSIVQNVPFDNSERHVLRNDVLFP